MEEKPKRRMIKLPTPKIPAIDLSHRDDPKVVLTMRCEDARPTNKADIKEACALCGHDCWLGTPLQALQPRRVLCLNCYINIKGEAPQYMPEVVEEVKAAVAKQDHNLALVLINIAYLYRLWDAQDHEAARHHQGPGNGYHRLEHIREVVENIIEEEGIKLDDVSSTGLHTESEVQYGKGGTN